MDLSSLVFCCVAVVVACFLEYSFHPMETLIELPCRFHECCRENWIPLNEKGLQQDLDKRLFGQHIASEVIPKAIRGFLRSPDPSKPLVISLNGPSGTGKNFITKIIAENLYKKGMNSSYVHLSQPTLSFPDPKDIDKFKRELQEKIKKSVKECPRSLFIFDEVDKMHPEIIDAIQPFLEYNELVEGVNYRKVIFIFLSNAGAEKITEFMLDIWKSGKTRESVQMKDLESLLTLDDNNEKNSGFWRSKLIAKNLIDYFVPFFPLEYNHVVQCAKSMLKAKGFRTDEQTAVMIADELIYQPKNEKIYSIKGCKTVSSKVDFHRKPMDDLQCKFQEYCSEDCIPLNVKGLQQDSDKRLFGQHIASEVIPKAIRGFLHSSDPSKPLVLSLHGSSGTGKNFISTIIAENLYKNGMSSSYVHLFLPALSFPDPKDIDKYKRELQEKIQKSVKECSRSLFIFDEMDKTHPEIINAIKPFLEYNELIEGVSYRKAIFIFLSNAGAEKITEYLLDIWKSGNNRESVQMKDLESILTLEVYNKKNSGFWHRKLIDKNLVDYLVPFLPLEYKHVLQCAKSMLKARGFRTDEQTAITIADEIFNNPKNEKIYSIKGCKTVSSKVDFHGQPA